MDTRISRTDSLKCIDIDNEAYELLADPINWNRSAQSLHRAALVLADVAGLDARYISDAAIEVREGLRQELPEIPPPVLAQFVFLASLALENLFKGLIIYREPEVVAEGKIAVTTHDLLELSRRAGVQLSVDERRFCATASHAVVGWGRYPVSKSGKSALSCVTITGNSIRVFDELYGRVRSLYPERFLERKRP